MIHEHGLLASTLAAGFVSAVLAFLAICAGWRWYAKSFEQGIGTSLNEAFINAKTGRLLRYSVAATATGTVIVWALSDSVLFGVIVAITLPILPWQLVRSFRAYRLKRLLASLPDSTMLLAGNLRSGLALQGALARMVAQSHGPLAQEFSLLLSELRLGLSFDSALSNLDVRVGSQDMTILVAAIKMARDTGGNLAETLERLADTLRRKAEIEGKIAALTAQGRLQGWVMAALPIVLMVVLYRLEPAAMSPLLHTWYGWLVLAAIALLELSGILLIRKIVSIEI